MPRMLLVAYAASLALTAGHPLGMTFTASAIWAVSVAIFVFVLTAPRKA